MNHRRITGSVPRRSLALLAGATCIFTGALAVTPAYAQQATLDAGDGADWQQYVLGQDAFRQSPVAVFGTTGDVANAAALVNGTGSATLTTTDVANPATIILDWGVERSGNFVYGVQASAAGARLKTTTSETQFGLYSSTSVSTKVAVGATSLNVTSATGMVVGDQVWVGDQLTNLTSVGAASASGVPITVADPLSKAFDPRTPVAVVKSTRIVGDNSGFGGSASQTTTLTGPGELRISPLFGGFRFQAIQLTSPGSITLDSSNLDSTAFVAGPDDYAGHFASSDEALTRAWYTGAYTAQTNMIPAAVTGKSLDLIYDGAKRDRGVWSGDLLLQAPAARYAFGSAADSYIEGSLRDLFANQAASGKIPGTSWIPFLAFYSDTYSDFSASAAIDYYRQSGDQEFAAEFKQRIERGVDYQQTKVNARGVVQVAGDPHYWQTALTGEVSEYNMVYFELLQDAIWFESQLGDAVKADAYSQRAASLKTAIQTHLWSAELGAYPISNDTVGNRASIPADANAHALILGLVPQEHVSQLLDTLQLAWTPNGALMSRSTIDGSTVLDPSGQAIEPLPNTWEVEARFRNDDAEGALDLARAYWSQQVDEDHPYYTGTTWEFLGATGAAMRSSTSFAHGWGAGISSLLTEYTLGVQPIAAGYDEWRIAPEPGDLTWASGSVPAGDESIDARWTNAKDAFTLKAVVPEGTTGTISVPMASENSAVRVNGKLVWNNGKAVGPKVVDSLFVAASRLEIRVSAGTTYEVLVQPNAARK